MTPLEWMFVGYSVIWAAIALYVSNLGRRQAAMERDVVALRAALDADLAVSAAETAAAPDARVP